MYINNKESIMTTKYRFTIMLENPQRTTSMVIEAENPLNATGIAEAYGRIVNGPVPLLPYENS